MIQTSISTTSNLRPLRIASLILPLMLSPASLTFVTPTMKVQVDSTKRGPSLVVRISITSWSRQLSFLDSSGKTTFRCWTFSEPCGMVRTMSIKQKLDSPFSAIR